MAGGEAVERWVVSGGGCVGRAGCGLEMAVEACGLWVGAVVGSWVMGGNGCGGGVYGEWRWLWLESVWRVKVGLPVIVRQCTCVSGNVSEQQPAPRTVLPRRDQARRAHGSRPGYAPARALQFQTSLTSKSSGR